MSSRRFPARAVAVVVRPRASCAAACCACVCAAAAVPPLLLLGCGCGAASSDDVLVILDEVAGARTDGAAIEELPLAIARLSVEDIARLLLKTLEISISFSLMVQDRYG